MILYPKKDWIPPMSLWLTLDFSHLTTKKQFQEIHSILKRLPDNENELRILSKYYTLKRDSLVPPISAGWVEPSQKDLRAPESDKRKIPFMKKPLKYIKQKR